MNHIAFCVTCVDTTHMKKNNILTVLMILAVFLVGSPVYAQKGNQDAAKRTEKIRKEIAKVGTGELAAVSVLLADNSDVKGYISEANDKSFVLVDKNAAKRTITYAEVQSVSYHHRMGKTTKYVLIGVAAGVGIFLALTLHSLLTDGGAR
jgi:hypothetical protein